jgi:hypothetical protein
MVTMMKEKVNTHFSFPLRLDMTPYTEDFLMGKSDRKEGKFIFSGLCQQGNCMNGEKLMLLFNYMVLGIK